MKAPVRAGQCGGIVDQRVISLNHIAQHLYLFAGGMARCQPGRKTLQFTPYHVELRHLVVIKGRNNQRPAVPFKQGLRFQSLQRLADRRARDPEPFRKVAFDQTVAGFEDTHVNRLQDEAIRIGVRRLGSGHGGVFLFCNVYRRGSAPINPAVACNAGLSYTAAMVKDSFSHVSYWVFDLDNTLYPPAARLFDQIEVRMTRYVMDALCVEQAEADRLRTHYWHQYGTTLAGLMREHDVDPTPYLTDVHDISLDHLEEDRMLAAHIAELPGRRIVYTNGTAPYAEKVLEARGLSGLFDGIYGVEHACYLPKPERAAFEQIFARDGTDPTLAAMFEDDPRNLAEPHAMGMRTVHVAPDPHKADHIHHHTSDLTSFLRKLT